MTARTTIRHDGTSRSIVAYLAACEGARKCVRICAYMELMHFVSGESTRLTLKNLADSGTIERVARGIYRRRWELAG